MMHKLALPPLSLSVNSWASVAFLLLVIAPFMLVEMLRSQRNEYYLRKRGAIEPDDYIYPLMRVVYPASFILMTLEGVWRGGPREPMAGLVIFTLAKALKFWAIVTLGDRWSFRVLILPQAPLIARGPYRFIRHPNYVGVMGELIGTLLFMPAPLTGTIMTLFFLLILRIRIGVEEQALGLRP